MSHEPKAAWPPPGGTVTQSRHFAERPDPVEPSGCRFYGVSDRDHMQRWMDGVGWHTWADPTQEQRKE